MISKLSPSKKPCVKYINGKCKRDAKDCFFSHEPMPAKSMKTNCVCLFHLKGKCFYGEHCWYYHPNDIKYWIIEWFTDKVSLLYNEEVSPEGKHTIVDFNTIGEELNFLLSCFRAKRAKISTIHINFQTLNFANAFVFNVSCCKILASIKTLHTLQLSLGTFEFLLIKLDEIGILLEKSVKLKNLTITDLNKKKSLETNKHFQNAKILYFTRQLKESYLEYFEIEAVRASSEYDQTLRNYLFIIASLMKSQICFLKFSLNQDLSFLVETAKNKIGITINFSSMTQMKQLLIDFWEGVSNLASFKEVRFNFISDWFSGIYTHEILIHKIPSLTYLELDFRRIKVNIESIEMLWKDLRTLNCLSNLRVLFPNAYIDPKILVSVGEYLKSASSFLKAFFIKIKIMFFEENEIKHFLINLTKLRQIQKLELSLDMNILQLWTDDQKKQLFLEDFVREMLRKARYLMNFTYSDRSIQLRMNEEIEKWLLLRRLMVQHLLLMKREKISKMMRREIVYEVFRNIHRRTIKDIEKGLGEKKLRVSCVDLAENESDSTFYERFLQI